MAEPTVHHVEATVTGRYLARSASGGTPAPLLVGFHGYGENAEEHLASLAPIPGIESWHVVAIQALHPFYRGRTGEVVATWMTRLDRERAIVDNLRYVGAALTQARTQLAVEGPLAAIGFSQGTAMAYRAVAGSGHSFDGLVALAGDVPPDAVEAAKSSSSDAFPAVLIGRGTEDDWYSEEKMANDRELLGSIGVTPETCVFAGGHEWTPDFYRACAEFLAAL